MAKKPVLRERLALPEVQAKPGTLARTGPASLVKEAEVPRAVLEARCVHDDGPFWITFRHNQHADRFYFERSSVQKPDIQSAPYRLQQILVETATCPHCRGRLTRACIFRSQGEALVCTGPNEIAQLGYLEAISAACGIARGFGVRLIQVWGGGGLLMVEPSCVLQFRFWGGGR